MDGGNSFQRRANGGMADQRQYDPEYFLKRDEVNQWSGEVPYRPKKGRKGKGKVPLLRVPPVGNGAEANGHGDGEGGDGSGDEVEGGDEDEGGSGDHGVDESDSLDADDRTGTEARCADNWKASNGRERKEDGCEQCGLFIGLCRHGLCEWLVEMVQSGELYVARLTLSLMHC